jgi:hypothetical protein
LGVPTTAMDKQKIVIPPPPSRSRILRPNLSILYHEMT